MSSSDDSILSALKRIEDRIDRLANAHESRKQEDLSEKPVSRGDDCTHFALKRVEDRIDALARKNESPKRKSPLEWLNSLSTLISGVLIAGVGTFATMQYNTTQTTLAQLEALDKYRAYLAADNPQERLFGYEAFVALGQEEFVARLIGIRRDSAGEPVLLDLVESGKDSAVREAARDSLLSLPQERRLIRIVNIFETGRPESSYDSVRTLPGDPAILAYGFPQVTLSSGNLALLIYNYISNPEARYRIQLEPYLSRLKSVDPSLADDKSLHNILGRAGADPIMRQIQDEFFRRTYFEPAFRNAQQIGIKSLLGIATVYDSFLHGGWPRIRDRTTDELGGTPLDGIDEKRWIKTYLRKRIEWLENHSIQILRRVIYRPEALLKLAEDDNWELIPPFDIRGIVIDE